MKQIYLVEDEAALASLLEKYLIEAGYDVKVFNNGLDAKASMDQLPDLWVLDIMLPDISGYELIKHIKGVNEDIPVIFMSARNAEIDRVVGLEMGSDDYLPKPFMPRELVLRVNRLLKVNRVSHVKKGILLGQSYFDIEKHIIVHGEENIHLTVKEYDLLLLFVNRKNQALSRNDILDSVWGDDYFGTDRVIDDTLRRLRKKVIDLPIETVYGYGYMLKVEENEV